MSDQTRPKVANTAELQRMVNRRRRLIADLVQLEETLSAAGVISRRVVRTRRVVHGRGRYTAEFEDGIIRHGAQGKLDGLRGE